MYSCPSLFGTLPVFEEHERRDFIATLLYARPKHFAALLVLRIFHFSAVVELFVYSVVGVSLCIIAVC